MPCSAADRRPSDDEPAEGNREEPPARAVFICNNLGLHMPYFVPEQSGEGYEPSRYLKVFRDELREKLTVFSGMSHPDVDGGHAAEKSWLTGAPHPGSGSFKNSISVDQLAAERIGHRTRYRSLVLTANGTQSLSWTRSGVPIPGQTSPSQVFRQLFIDGGKKERQEQITRLQRGASVMDLVLDEAKSIRRRLTADDRRKFEQYTDSVRDVEQEMVRLQEWQNTPKPRVDAKSPTDIRGQEDTIGRSRLMYDLVRLALQTDQTRLATILSVGFFAVPPIDGVTEGYHTVSHHGMDPDKLQQLALIEMEHLRLLADFLDGLKSVREGGRSLLDSTMVLFGSDMGNASSHSNANLPLILAGGGFNHGSHVAHNPERNAPMANVLLSMLHRLGIDEQRFASSTGTASELDVS